MKRKQNIQNAFIITIIANVIADFGLILASLGFNFFYSILTLTPSSLVMLFVIVSVTFSPFILSIVALSLLRGVKPINAKEKVFRIITKVSSIMLLVVFGLLISYIVIVVWLIGLLVAVYAA